MSPFLGGLPFFSPCSSKDGILALVNEEASLRVVRQPQWLMKNPLNSDSAALLG